ncbi:MAG: hypothetical protein LBU99_02910 [Spirochaetaceae bacterium]|jgi:hypothetical protein|nr:hypothetical protein [Spirochaetaceae bacterium]
MKFKVVILTFNIVLIVTFLALFCIPFFLIGSDFALDFMKRSWIICLCFVLMLVVMNVIFARNWQLFSIMEGEDWPALTFFLEKKLYEQKRFSYRYVKLLCESCILLSDFAGVQRLADFVSDRKPQLFARSVLGFAAALILQRKTKDAVALLERFHEDKAVKNRFWVEWYYGFALYLEMDFKRSMAVFYGLLSSSKNTVVTGLSLYMLEMKISPMERSFDDLRSETALAKNSLLRRESAGSWKRRLEAEKNEVPVVILGKILDDAAVYLY